MAISSTLASNTNCVNRGFAVIQGLSVLVQHLFSSCVGIGLQFWQLHQSGTSFGGPGSGSWSESPGSGWSGSGTGEGSLPGSLIRTPTCNSPLAISAYTAGWRLKSSTASARSLTSLSLSTRSWKLKKWKNRIDIKIWIYKKIRKTAPNRKLMYLPRMSNNCHFTCSGVVPDDYRYCL